MRLDEGSTMACPLLRTYNLLTITNNTVQLERYPHSVFVLIFTTYRVSIASKCEASTSS